VDIKQIKELMAAMEKMGIKRLRFKEKERYELELESVSESNQHSTSNPGYFHPEVHYRFPSAPVVPPQDSGPIQGTNVVGPTINSPMVGTFYQASLPDAPPFIKVGQAVKKGDKICIIEAMKVMNEIQSDKDGVISKILTENGKPVEFGQPLFEIQAS
jgi:acetyl-CoA carboxylase biotin carboxyl carrier protein